MGVHHKTHIMAKHHAPAAKTGRNPRRIAKHQAGQSHGFRETPLRQAFPGSRIDARLPEGPIILARREKRS